MNLIEKLQESAAADRAAALENYRAILSRADDPKPNDEKRLREAMGVLGFDIGRLERDLRAIREAASLEAQAAAADEDLDRQIEEAGRTLDAHQIETARISEERTQRQQALWATFTDLQQQRNRAGDARGKLIELRRRHFELFGEPAPEPEPMPQLQQTPMDAPNPVKIAADNAKVRRELPWGASDGSGTQIGLAAKPADV
jgi:hypothetical protein